MAGVVPRVPTPDELQAAVNLRAMRWPWCRVAYRLGTNENTLRGWLIAAGVDTGRLDGSWMRRGSNGTRRAQAGGHGRSASGGAVTHRGSPPPLRANSGAVHAPLNHAPVPVRRNSAGQERNP